MIYGLTYQQVFPQIEKLAKVGNVVMPDLWNLNPYLFIALFAAITVFLFYLIDRAGLQRKRNRETKEMREIKENLFPQFPSFPSDNHD